MSIDRRLLRSRRAGLALASDALVVHTGSATHQIPLAGATAEGWPSLAHGLRAVRRWLGPRAVAPDLALLPPLVQTRIVALPRLRRRELARLVRQNVASYFPVNATGLVLAVRGRRRGDRTLTFVAAAEARLLDAIHAAAREAGCPLRSIIAAESAWIAAALHGAHTPRGAWRILVPLDDRLELLEMAGDDPWLVRRLPGGAIDAARLATILGETARPDIPLRVVGTAATALDGEPGLAASERPAVTVVAADAPAVTLAACWAHAARGPQLVTDAERAADARLDRRRAGVLGACALLLALAGGALEARTTHRELGRIEALRASIRPRVTRAVSTRDRLARTASRLAEVDAARRTSPRWSSVLAALARSLPGDAHLLSVRGDGDSLTIEGVGASAATVLASLRGLDGARDVRARSPITQETGAGGALVERFAFTLVLAPWGTPRYRGTPVIAATHPATRQGVP